MMHYPDNVYIVGNLINIVERFYCFGTVNEVAGLSNMGTRKKLLMVKEQ